MKQFLQNIPRKIITPRLEIDLLVLSDSDDLSDEILGASWEDMHIWVGWVKSRYVVNRESYRRAVQKNIDNFENGTAYFGVSRLLATGELGPQVTLYNMNQQDHRGDYGYWTPKNVTGKGMTQEASVAMLQLGFQYYGLQKIFANHSEGNVASRAILRRLGFEFTHVVEKGGKRGSGEEINAYHYMLDDVYKLPFVNCTFK